MIAFAVNYNRIKSNKNLPLIQNEKVEVILLESLKQTLPSLLKVTEAEGIQTLSLVGKQLSLLGDKGGFKQVLNKLKYHIADLSVSDACLLMTICARFEMRDEEFAKLCLHKLDLADNNHLTNLAFSLYKLHFPNEFAKVLESIENRVKQGSFSFRQFAEVMNVLSLYGMSSEVVKNGFNQYLSQSMALLNGDQLQRILQI